MPSGAVDEDGGGASDALRSLTLLIKSVEILNAGFSSATVCARRREVGMFSLMGLGICACTAVSMMSGPNPLYCEGASLLDPPPPTPP